MSVQHARIRRSRSPDPVFIMAASGVPDDRSRCSASAGIGVQLQPERPFRMVRITHLTMDRSMYADPAVCAGPAFEGGLLAGLDVVLTRCRKDRTERLT